METLVSVNCAEQAACSSPAPHASIWQDILAQAVTGELMAALNYTALSTICDEAEEVAEAMEHAEGEQGHAAAFAAEGRKLTREELSEQLAGVICRCTGYRNVITAVQRYIEESQPVGGGLEHVDG